MPRKSNKQQPDVQTQVSSVIDETTIESNKPKSQAVVSLGKLYNKVVTEERYGRAIARSMHYIDRTIHHADRSVDFMTRRKGYEDRDEVMQFARPSMVFGMWTILVVFGIFGLWSAVAPLDSAAVARGTVVVESNKKTIQHLEGGIIKEILVHEGDKVIAGQPLIKLSETAAKTRQATLQSQLYATMALENRLNAERDERNEISFDKELLAHQDDPEVKKAIESQTRTFISRRDAMNGKIAVLNQRKAEYDDQISGLEAQQSATHGQSKLIKDEVDIVDTLLKSGNANKPRLLALQRRQQELGGIRGQYLSDISKAKQSITEADMEIINTRNQMLNEVLKELRDTQVNVADLREKERAAQDVVDRLVIAAPQAGTINGLMFHTVGGVIAPGTTIMDIIPDTDKKLIDAQVSPQDIDGVQYVFNHPDKEHPYNVRIRLTAFRQRTTPLIHGRIINVSADKFTDRNTPGTPSYYVARIEPDQEELSRLKNVELYPGMPADVLIVTGSRTFLHYLLSPIWDTMEHAFREKDR